MLSEKIHKGLDGIVADTTAISEVNEAAQSLTYRGYAVDQLAHNCHFEEVAYLLWYGELPNAAQLAAFQALERSQRQISPALFELLRKLPQSAHPMDRLRTAISYLGVEDLSASDIAPEALQQKSVTLFSKLPTIVAALYRLDHRKMVLPPKPNLNFTENFLYMCFGAVPDPLVVRVFDMSMTLYAEHSFNASTFAARVIASTLSDIYSAVTGAIGALKGPLHGGANEAIMDVLQDIGTTDNVDVWVADAMKRKQKVTGFGHRVYKHGDSRVPAMTEGFHALTRFYNQLQLIEITERLKAVMARQKNLYPNLDFPAGPSYALMGLPREIFTPIFVMSRITGWTAHIMEQLADNKLIRPLSAYNGHAPRQLPE